MTTETAEAVKSGSTDDDYDHDHDRSLDPDRYRRAVTETMAVERAADRLYSVSNGDSRGDGEAYTVDLATGACECPDARWRSQTVCKHAIRASLVDVYWARKARSALAARVIAFANEHGCPAATRGCNGPFRAHSAVVSSITALVFERCNGGASHHQRGGHVMS